MYRTVNLNWETKWAHNYTFTQDGNELEKGKRRDLHKISFSTMIPVLKLKKVSLYANVQYRSYQFDAIEKNHSATSAIFSQDGYDYFAGGLNGTYYINVFNKPLALSASVIADGWDKRFWQSTRVIVCRNDFQAYKDHHFHSRHHGDDFVQ